MTGLLIALLAVSGDRVASLDAVNNTVQIGAQTISVGETPMDALFAGGDLFVLCRDAGTVERISSSRKVVEVARDSVFLREAGGLLYVYSRGEGILQEIDPERMEITRRARVEPFASDLEISGSTIYLVYPREAVIRMVDRTKLMPAGEIKAGAVPVDLAIARGANAVSAPALHVADPSAKRIWTMEGRQSFSAAVARGFVRGLLGLGLFRPRGSEFPTGVDRVFPGGFAYDSSSATLYRVRRGKVSVVAKNLPPGAFAATERGLMVWKGGVLQHLE